MAAVTRDAERRRGEGAGEYLLQCWDPGVIL